MIAGIVLFALGLKKTIEHVGEPLATVPAVALCGGLSLYFLTHVALRIRLIHDIRARDHGQAGLDRPRQAGHSVGMLALLPAALEVSALTALALVTGLCCALIAYDVIHYRENAPRYDRRGPSRPRLAPGEHVGEPPVGERAEERVPGQLRAARRRARDPGEESRLLSRRAERVRVDDRAAPRAPRRRRSSRSAASAPAREVAGRVRSGSGCSARKAPCASRRSSRRGRTPGSRRG